MPDNDRFQDITDTIQDAVNHPAPEYDPELSSTISETITIPKDGNVNDIERILRQISRVSNALAARMMLGTVVPENSIPIGAASPLVQHMFNCAMNAGAAIGILVSQREQQRQVLVPQMGMKMPQGRA